MTDTTTVRATLLALVDELGATTDEYCDRGTRLVTLLRLRDAAVAQVTAREDVLRLHHAPTIEAGKNEAQRKGLALQLLNDDGMLTNLREHAADLTTDYLNGEREYKNAYHQLDSLRVRIAALTALVGAEGMA